MVLIQNQQTYSFSSNRTMFENKQSILSLVSNACKKCRSENDLLHVGQQFVCMSMEEGRYMSDRDAGQKWPTCPAVCYVQQRK